MRNRVNRPLPIMPRAIQGVIDDAVFSQQVSRMCQVGITNPVTKHRIAPELLLFGVAAAMCENDGQRNLAIAEIVAAVLAHCCTVGHIVDRVINKLERNTKISAVGVKRQLLRVTAFGNDCSNSARRCK